MSTGSAHPETILPPGALRSLTYNHAAPIQLALPSSLSAASPKKHAFVEVQAARVAWAGVQITSSDGDVAVPQRRLHDRHRRSAVNGVARVGARKTGSLGAGIAAQRQERSAQGRWQFWRSP